MNNIQAQNEKTDSWKYINIDFNTFVNQKKQKDKILAKLPSIKKIKNITNNSKISKNTADIFDEFIEKNYTNGFFLEVKANKNIKDNKNIIENKIISDQQGLYVSKSIIKINKGVSINYLQQNIIKNNASRLEIINVFLEENSKMNFYYLINCDKTSQNIENLNILLGKGSHFNIVTAQKNGKLNRLKINIFHIAGNSESKIYNSFLGTNNDIIDITTNTIHDSLNTNSDIFVKGVVNEYSTSVYRGKIKITKKGQKTISFLSDHVLMLGDNSKSYSIPSLEIDANDVKASHSASTGKIEKEILFYLMSRGLSKKLAESLLTKGFLFDILNKITDKKIKDKFILFFENKFFT